MYNLLESAILEVYILKRYEIFYPSSDGVTQIHALKWIPDGDINGIVQIVHGMSEHIERYSEFANFMVENGYAVCGNDHLGHGMSVSSDQKYGYFSDDTGNGWKNLIEDMYTLMSKMKSEFESDYILLGHSMGSVLARHFCTLYSDNLKAGIFSGTMAGNPFIDIAIKLCQKKIQKLGALYPADDINKLAFGRYNRKAYPRHSNFDWLSRDIDEVDRYINDDMCQKSRVFTYGGFLDLFSIIKYTSGKKWATKIPYNFPMYFFSGNMDPVGNYSHGVVKVIDWLTATNHTEVKVKFYEDGRHEMLHEINRDFVYRDILKWIKKQNSKRK